MGEKLMLDGVSIYYEHHGQPITSNAQVLVLIHGYLSSCFSFRLLLPYLEKDFIIYTLDLPGFGQSEKSMTFNYSLGNYGKLIVDFLRHFDLDQVVLVGHSMGGQIALQAARQEQQRINKVVGLAAAGYMGPVKRPLVLLSYFPFFNILLKMYFNKRDVVENFLEVTHNRRIITKEMMDGYLAPLKEKAFYKSFIRFIRHREGDMPTELVKTIKQPVSLIWGKQDQIVPLSIGERFEKDLPNAILTVFDETGHLLPEEKPEEVADVIRRFVL